MTSSHHHAAAHLADKAYDHTYGDGSGGPVTGGALATEAVARALLAINDTLQGLVAPPEPSPVSDCGPAEEPALAALRAALGWGDSSYWRRARLQQLIEARDLEGRRQWAARIEETGRAKGWSLWAAAFLSPDIEFVDGSLPSTESVVAELRRLDRTDFLRGVRRALLGEYGNELDDDTQITAQGIRHVLSELETALVQGTAEDDGPGTTGPAQS